MAEHWLQHEFSQRIFIGPGKVSPANQSLAENLSEVVVVIELGALTKEAEEKWRRYARLIAAAPALLEALTGGERENPQLRRIEWLDALLREISDGDLKWPDGPEDPDAAAEMLWELAEMVRQARAAIAAAKGEGE